MVTYSCKCVIKKKPYRKGLDYELSLITCGRTLLNGCLHI